MSRAADQRVMARMRDLVAAGETVLSTRKDPPLGAFTDATVDSEAAHRWLTSALSIVARACGADSDHYRRLLNAGEPKFGLTFGPTKRALGVLRAALDDVEGGYLFEVRQLVEAEVFVDFLDQAEELLDAGYHGPAAVVVGCVLEDALRRLCERHGIELPDKPKLDWMNSELRRAGAYDKLTMKQITAFADVRNSAAHGRWDEFDATHVQDMSAWVGRFLEARS